MLWKPKHDAVPLLQRSGSAEGRRIFTGSKMPNTQYFQNYLSNPSIHLLNTATLLECSFHSLCKLGDTSGHLAYRCAPAAGTRSRPCEGGWTTGPLPVRLRLSAGGAPSARCSTGSTPPMPAPRWWAARRTSAPPPKTVPGARPSRATLRRPWEQLPLSPHPRRFCS